MDAQQHRHCPDCGYLLVLPEPSKTCRCPECGLTWSAADLLSVPPPTAIDRAVMSGLQIIIYAIGCGAMLVILLVLLTLGLYVLVKIIPD